MAAKAIRSLKFTFFCIPPTENKKLVVRSQKWIASIQEITREAKHDFKNVNEKNAKPYEYKCPYKGKYRYVVCIFF